MQLVALGRAVRESRLKLNLTQAELAEIADLHPTYISRVETGDANVSFETVTRIAHALKMRAAWLVDRANL